MKSIRFFDYVAVAPKVVGTIPADPGEKTKFIDSVLKSGSGVLVRTIAQHAARKVRNHAMYLPSKIVGGKGTMLSRERGGTAAYDKPVLRNHDDGTPQTPFSAPGEGKILGRAIANRYITYETKPTIQDRLVKGLNYLSDSTQDKPLWSYVDVIDELNSIGMFDSAEWNGVGHLEVDALITDPDAVAQILDRRYLTVSTGMTSNRAICSLKDCHQDWVSGGPCDHKPGHDGMFLIAGDLNYEEAFSFVVNPADAEAVVTEYKVIDSVQANGFKVADVDSSPYEINISFTDSFGSEPVVSEQPKTIKDIFPHISDEHLAAAEKLDINFTDVKTSLETLLKDAKGLDGSSMREVRELIGIHDSIHYSYDYLCSCMLKGEPMHDTTLSVDAFALHAKLHDLSMEKEFRDSLVNGPMDHFNSKGEKTDEYMMKMPGHKMSDVTTLESLVAEASVEDIVKTVLPAFSDSTSLKTILDSVKELCTSKNIPFNDVITVTNNTELDSLKAEVTKLTDSLNTETQAKKFLRLEMKDWVNKNSTLSNELKTAVSVKHDMLVEYTAVLKLASGDNGKFDDIKALQSGKTILELETEFNDLRSKVDFDNIVLRPHGTSGSKQGVVEDPGLQGAGKDTEPNVARDSINRERSKYLPYIDRYNYFLKVGGKTAADSYVANMKAAGFFPKDFNIEALLANNEPPKAN